jgi:hypothetical protein
MKSAERHKLAADEVCVPFCVISNAVMMILQELNRVRRELTNQQEEHSRKLRELEANLRSEEVTDHDSFFS